MRWGEAMKIERIVVATQFEEIGLPEVRCLLALRASGLREIVFLFVVDRDEVAFNFGAGFDHAYRQELEEKARLHFLDWEKEAARHGVATRHRVELGSPAGKIIATACDEKADLVAIGSRHNPLDAVYPHGVDLEVVRRSTMPVLVFRPGGVGDGREWPELFARVLFPTDFSEGSGRAFRFVQALRGAARRVELLHVLTDKEVRSASREVRELEARERAELDRLAGELHSAGLEAAAHLAAGDIVGEIVSSAAEWRCGCVVMGTTGKHGFMEAVKRSPSHDVLLADVPVTILVPPESAVCNE
jgi:nucleotide-binding universal stress UspA family protein